MKWTPRLLEKIANYASQGLTDTQIAHNIGIHQDTFFAWKRIHPELVISLERAREPVYREVENALYKRAVGYEYTELETVKLRGRVIRKKKTKEVSPDVKAQIFYLTNRLPEKWRFSSKIETQVQQNGTAEIDLSKLTDKQLSQLTALMKEINGNDGDAEFLEGIDIDDTDVDGEDEGHSS